MKTIKVYTTPTCPWCVKVKEYFRHRDIIFDDIDVSKDPANVQELMNVSGQYGVPVIVVDDQIVIGYDPVRIAELLQDQAKDDKK
ncbi:MAG: glutaredoxin domain-containing protein [Planctomycetota bacterium]